MNYLYFPILASVLCSAIKVTNYCDKTHEALCNGKGEHVACQFLLRGPGVSCKNYTKIVFDKNMINFVLRFVNSKRQTVAQGRERLRDGMILPMPKYMTIVKWSKDLAFLAQRLADQCMFIHDQCRATVEYPFAGQTVGELRSRTMRDYFDPKRSIKTIFNTWWNEKGAVYPDQLFTGFQVNNELNTPIWGDFSQLIIKSLEAMGCGAVIHDHPTIKLLLVCDFSTTNMLGEPTLLEGPTKQCPGEMERNDPIYPLLCGPAVHEKVIDEFEGQHQNNYDVVNRYIINSIHRKENIKRPLSKGVAYSKLRKYISADESAGLYNIKQRSKERNYYEDDRDDYLSYNSTKNSKTAIRPKNNINNHNQIWVYPIDKEDIEQIYKDTGYKIETHYQIGSHKNKVGVPKMRKIRDYVATDDECQP